MQRTGITGWMALVMAITFATGARAQSLVTETVQRGVNGNVYSAEGVVEAVRSSVIGADLAGRVTALLVKAGDRVQAGQVLARIDERVAAQQAVASQAQVAAAQAQLAAAQADFDRRQKLYEQKFLSKAALDRAESDYKSAAAQARAQIAQANVAGVQTGLHTLTAPYTGIVAETNIELGDMVMPGKPLLAVYDPNALRVTINLPQSQLANLKSAPVTVEIPGAKAPTISIAAGNVVVLPTADPVSHMVQVRIALPAKVEGSSQSPGRPKIDLAPLGGGSGQRPDPGVQLVPGMFARALLPTQGPATTGRTTVPSGAVITRSELTAVYVVDNTGHASLRQVRLGRHQGERIEVLAGLEAGEKIALDPLAAAKQR